jgi:hypothetical protein
MDNEYVKEIKIMKLIRASQVRSNIVNILTQKKKKMKKKKKKEVKC